MNKDLILDEIERQTSGLFKDYSLSQPGFQIGINICDKISYTKSYGIANLEFNTFINNETLFEIGSTSKQFTAASILLLEQKGKLSVEDDILKYLPEANFEFPVTIRHLLHHTSGIRDWGCIASLTGWPRGTKEYTNKDVLEIIARQSRLNNKPNEEFIYSNSNYNLLAVIVERASGMNFFKFVEKYIFSQAQMNTTQYLKDFNRIIFNRATSYRKYQGMYFADDLNEYVYGNRGVLTNASDLLIWFRYLVNTGLGNPSLTSKQLETFPLNDESINPYAAGFYIKKVNDRLAAYHGGSTGSFRVFAEFFPEAKSSLVWLSNTSEFDDSLTTILKKFEQMVCKLMDQFCANEKESYLNIPTNLDTRNAALTPAEQDLFAVIKNSRLNNSILGDETEQHYNEGKNTEPVGRYFSNDTSSFITVQEVNNHLVLDMRPYKKYSLTFLEEDKYAVPELDGMLIFVRNENNSVIKFLVSVPRARNVEYFKLPVWLK